MGYVSRLFQKLLQKNNPRLNRNFRWLVRYVGCQKFVGSRQSRSWQNDSAENSELSL